MSNGDLNWIANFIWGIADDVLRDLYVRGKYRDVILPMTVLRRLDALLEPTKKAVLDMKKSLDKAKIVHQDQPLRQTAGQDRLSNILKTFNDQFGNIPWTDARSGSPTRFSESLMISRQLGNEMTEKN
jgi:type I restriction-modification system DNA methylase subunit